LQRCRSAIAVDRTKEAATRAPGRVLDWRRAPLYCCGMNEGQDDEDRLIRKILIAVSTVAVLGFLATVALITVMVSCNFNILDWLE
jgi:hypothetical protein